MEPVVVLKGGMATLITLHLKSADLAVIQQELEQKRQDAAALFKNLPCAIDLQQWHPDELALQTLIELCKKSGLLPIAVRNATESWQATIDSLGLADLGRYRHSQQKNQSNNQLSSSQSLPEAKIYHGNIRSGQQLYHDGDLTIFGTVSAGAEVLASGSLHIYGALRGRALAGVKGNEQAIICCQLFDAELVSIAGQYRLFDDKNEYQQQTVAINLADSRLNIIRI